MTRPDAASWLGGSVLVWTIFTTTFLWTATTRGVFRTDISSWSVLGVQGTGREGTFWVFPDSPRWRSWPSTSTGRPPPLARPDASPAWHGLLAYIVIAGALQEGGGHSEGATWGVRIPLGRSLSRSSGSWPWPCS